MKRIVILAAALAAIGISTQATAAPKDLDALVDKVRKEALAEAAHDQERIERFLSERAEMQNLLQDARSKLAAENRRADRLRDEYETNEQTLTQYELDLAERAGDLTELFAIVRQTALNANSVMSNSLVSAENVDREAFLLELGKAEAPPTIDDIKRLWTSVLTEVVESGKVVSFDATVIRPQGDEVVQRVTRAGVFTAVSNGAFLRFLPDSGKLVQLSRQPTPRFQQLAKELEESQDGYLTMALDPTKGVILSMLVRSPDLKEKIKQGGVIGYLILVLGAIGLLLAVFRGLSLLVTRLKVNKQLASSAPDDKNPLGRLQKIANYLTDENMDAVSLRLDEQLAEESSKLNGGLPTIAVLAAVSPLLGLLGTVTGMIDTFQSITLYGTGDPKIMSGGISEALITTQLGLAVAIPLVLLHSLLTGRVNRLVEKLGKLTSDLVTGRDLDDGAEGAS